MEEDSSQIDTAERKIRLVLIGNGGAGKSALLGQWCGEGFNSHLGMTVGIDFREKELMVCGKHVRVEIWDTAGQERFWSLSPGYCRKADGIILVYDILNFHSFEGIEFWLEKIKLFAPPHAHFLLLGNKLDRATSNERAITKEMGEAAGKERGFPFFEVSALSGENLDEAMMKLLNDIMMDESGAVPPCENIIAVRRASVPDAVRMARARSCCASVSN